VWSLQFEDGQVLDLLEGDGVIDPMAAAGGFDGGEAQE
jgi:hypothetical protein